MAISTTDVAYKEGLIFTVRGLSLLEISDSVRRFRDHLRPIVSLAAGGAIADESSRAGNPATVQPLLMKVGEILDHIVGVAMVEPDLPFLLAMLPTSVKVAALGAILRHTLQEHSAVKLKTTLALAAISCLAASRNAHWVEPSRMQSGVN